MFSYIRSAVGDGICRDSLSTKAKRDATRCWHLFGLSEIGCFPFCSLVMHRIEHKE